VAVGSILAATKKIFLKSNFLIFIFILLIQFIDYFQFL